MNPRATTFSKHPRRDAGSTLAVTMCVVLAILSFLSIAALMTSQFGRFAERQRGSSETVTSVSPQPSA